MRAWFELSEPGEFYELNKDIIKDQAFRFSQKEIYIWDPPTEQVVLFSVPYLPDGVDIGFYIKNQYYVHQGQYWVLMGKNLTRTAITNFTMRVLYLIRSKDHPKRIVEIRNTYGAKALLELEIGDLVSLSDFKRKVEIGRAHV